MMIVRVACSMLALAPWAYGQRTVVVPKHLAKATGNSFGALGLWDHPLPRIVQQLFTVAPIMTGFVRHLAFRRYYMATSSPAFSVEMAVAMSNSPNDVYHPSPYVPANRGKDYTVTMRLRRVAFPAVAARQTAPYPFSYRLVFDRPFLLRPGKTAMWEVWIGRSTMPSKPAIPIDAYAVFLDTKRFDARKYVTRSFGRGCPSAGSNIIGLTGWAAIGSRVTTWKIPQSAGTSAIWAQTFAGSQASRWGPHRLPLNLAPYGAPGCQIYISLDVPLPGVNLGFSHQAILDIPNVAQLQGRKLYLQTLVFCSRVNALDLTVSPGLEVTVGPKPAIESSGLLSPWPWVSGGLKALGVWGNAGIWAHTVFELGY